LFFQTIVESRRKHHGLGNSSKKGAVSARTRPFFCLTHELGKEENDRENRTREKRKGKGGRSVSEHLRGEKGRGSIASVTAEELREKHLTLERRRAGPFIGKIRGKTRYLGILGEDSQISVEREERNALGLSLNEKKRDGTWRGKEGRGPKKKKATRGLVPSFVTEKGGN